MELVHGVENLSPRHRPCVATIGNYDGVHLGHQAVIKKLVRTGGRYRLPVTVVTFEPLAKEYFGIGPRGRLSTINEKARLLGEIGVDLVLCIRFDQRLAGQPPREFIQRVLVDGLGVRHLVVGDDFGFGRDRAGNFDMLVAAGRQIGFEVEAIDSFLKDGARVSSGEIRGALRDGDLERAERLLGRRFSISGRVARGDELGRTLGYPTANIPLDGREPPLSGVFAVSVSGDAFGVLPGVANVGTRPTVDGNQTRLEVHLFEFSGDIYGQHLHVEFIEKIRDEVRFEDVGTLRAQIERDTASARRIIGLSE